MKLPGLIQFRLCKLEDKDLMQRLSDHLNEMYKTGRIPARHIPAQPEEDFDLLLSELIVRFAENKNIDL